jgi:hypothetical protein
MQWENWRPSMEFISFKVQDPYWPKKREEQSSPGLRQPENPTPISWL